MEFTNKMSFSEAVPVVKSALENNIPIFLVGAPGVGKTSLYFQVVSELGWEMLVDFPVTLDPTVIGGFPHPADDGFIDLKPIRRYQKLVETKKPTVLFWDDLGQAPTEVQAVAMQVVLAKRIGNFSLSKEVRVVAASNRRQDLAGVRQVLEPLKSRFLIIELEPDLKSWTTWAFRNNIDTRVIAYLQFRPDDLNNFRPTSEMSQSPSPRGWERVSDCLRVMPRETWPKVVYGNVGEAAAANFISFIEMEEKLPSVEYLIENPGEIENINDPGARWAITTSLIHYADNNNINQCLDVVGHMTEEYQYLFIVGIVETKPHVLDNCEKANEMAKQINTFL